MSLLTEFLSVAEDCAVFPQQRTFQRAVRQARGSLVCLFHLNLRLGLRLLQASLLAPHRNSPVGTRALPFRFREVSRIKRPGKRATEQMQQQYREAVTQR